MPSPSQPRKEWLLFGVPFCSECVKAKEILTKIGLDFRYIECEKGRIPEDLEMEDQVAALAALAYQDGLFPVVLDEERKPQRPQDAEVKRA